MSDLEERARDRLVDLPGHFSTKVRIEGLESIGDESYVARIRTLSGRVDETVLTRDELDAAIASVSQTQPVGAPDLFRWVESHRIRLAYAHDPYFAVSLSGVRGLPHQVEAVYRHLLPQPRLRSSLRTTLELARRSWGLINEYYAA